MRWRRVAVRGPSMSPALHDGDVVIVRFGAPVRSGDVVLVRWPARPGQLSVKRAVRAVDDGWWVHGDNPLRLDGLPRARAGGRRRGGAGPPVAPAGPHSSRALSTVAAARPVASPPYPTAPPPTGRDILWPHPEGPSGTVSGLHPRASGAPASGRAPATTRIEGKPTDDDRRHPARDRTRPDHRRDHGRARRGQALHGSDRAPARRPRPVHLLHPGRRAGQPARSPPTRRSPPATPGRTAWSRWSATAPPCSASATSAPRAALPVMEGKSALFKTFGGLDSIPLVLDTTDVDEIVETLVRLRPSLRRGEPRRRLRAALLRAGAPADRGAGLPGHARRPARHRDRPARRAARRRARSRAATWRGCGS